MTKTIAYIATSLDGYVAGVDDDLSWLDPYSDVEYGFDAFVATLGVEIFGRRTYDILAERGWLNSHNLPTYVLSLSRPEAAPPLDMDVEFIKAPLEVVIEKARQRTDKDIWVSGGGNVIQQFLNARLIDELVLSIVPVTLGGGVRLFQEGQPSHQLTLVKSETFDRGLIQLTYMPAR